MSEEDQGFIIRDKRGKTEAEPPQAPESPSAASVHDSASQSHEADTQQSIQPPVSFSSFVFSLGTSALMLMGETLDPQQPTMPVNLPQAKEIIDILSILETKTKGNLSSEETSVLGDMLYTLRMKYVEGTSGKPQPSSS